jgi:hypothetical protein
MLQRKGREGAGELLLDIDVKRYVETVSFYETRLIS